MRRTIVVICLVAAVMGMSWLFAASAHAWQVTIKNSCYGILSVVVYGEHLFWKEKECTMEINEHETKTCVLPGLICPIWVGAYLYMPQYGQTSGMNEVSLNGGIAACWNHTLEAVKDGGAICVWKK